jgi:hypothetical protein
MVLLSVLLLLSATRVEPPVSYAVEGVLPSGAQGVLVAATRMECWGADEGPPNPAVALFVDASGKWHEVTRGVRGGRFVAAGLVNGRPLLLGDVSAEAPGRSPFVVHQRGDSEWGLSKVVDMEATLEGATVTPEGRVVAHLRRWKRDGPEGWTDSPVDYESADSGLTWRRVRRSPGAGLRLEPPTVQMDGWRVKRDDATSMLVQRQTADGWTTVTALPGPNPDCVMPSADRFETVDTITGRSVAIGLKRIGEGPVEQVIARPPVHGSVAADGDTLTYTPDDGFAGEDSFAVYVRAGTTAWRTTVQVTIRRSK